MFDVVDEFSPSRRSGYDRVDGRAGDAADRAHPCRHEHEGAEEVYVVLAGSGRTKLDDDVLDIGTMDAIRVAHHEGDGELFPGWWSAPGSPQ
jgi:hypothetical protein